MEEGNSTTAYKNHRAQLRPATDVFLGDEAPAEDEILKASPRLTQASPQKRNMRTEAIMQRKQLKRSSNLIQRPKYEPRATTAEAKPARSMKATTADELPAGDNYKLLKAKTTWSLSQQNQWRRQSHQPRQSAEVTMVDELPAGIKFTFLKAETTQSQ